MSLLASTLLLFLASPSRAETVSPVPLGIPPGRSPEAALSLPWDLEPVELPLQDPELAFRLHLAHVGAPWGLFQWVDDGLPRIVEPGDFGIRRWLLDPDQTADQVQALRGRPAGPMLLMVPFGLLSRCSELQPVGAEPLPVQAVPETDDLEVAAALALQARSMDCGLLLEERRGLWVASLHGSCPTPPILTTPETWVADQAANTRDVAARAASLQGYLGDSLLVAAVGPAAQPAVRAALRRNARLPLLSTRVPFAGDPDEEMAHALARAGVSCGIRVEEGDTGWLLSVHGDCRPVETRLQTPPGVAEALAEVEAGGDRGALRARYGLETKDLGGPVARELGATWAVVDGAGGGVGTTEVVRLTGDPDLRWILAEDARLTERRQMIHGVGAATLFISSGIAFGLANRDIPAWRDYRPDRAVFRDKEQYLAARDDARRRWERDMADLPQSVLARREHVVMTGAVLAASGVMLAATIPALKRGVAERRRHPGLTLDRSAVEETLDSYNGRLHLELGPPPELEEDDLVPDLPDDLPEDLPEDAADDLPEEPLEPQGRRRPLTVEPLVSPLAVGIRGRF